MNIVVLVKQVPDTYSERKLRDSDGVLDRDATDAVLDEINERAVEAALQIKESGDAEVTVLTMGPDRATDAIRKALSMGADKAVHVSDEALAGSDAITTAKVLAKAIGTVGEVDLVPEELGRGFDLMLDIKRTLDPNNIMNPGKYLLDRAYEGASEGGGA